MCGLVPALSDEPLGKERLRGGGDRASRYSRITAAVTGANKRERSYWNAAEYNPCSGAEYPELGNENEDQHKNLSGDFSGTVVAFIVL